MMRMMLRAAALLAVMLAALPGVHAAEAAGASAEIPLHVRPGGSGFANLMTVSVGGGPPGTVLFDTGSTGLRILASAVGPDVRLTDIPVRYSYTSGNVLDGVIGYAKVAFPGATPSLATPKEIAIQVVQRVSCKVEVPHCPGWRNGQVGVLGTAYNPLPLFNPLAQLDADFSNGFIVVSDDLVRPGIAPHVVVGLTAGNTAGFSFAPFDSATDREPPGQKAWNTKSVRTCFQVDGSVEDCHGTVFDTGAGSGSFALPDRPAKGFVGAGSLVTTSVPEAGMRISIKAGTAQWTDRYRYAPPHGSVPGYNSGGLIFRRMQIAFDAVAGRIGFRAP